jgi:hypothetical protein
MSEHEMRLRVFRFLKTRMRNMIMPATVGIGLVVGGACVGSDPPAAVKYSAPVYQDAASVTNADGFGGIPIYSAPVYRDAAATTGDSLLTGDISGPDLADSAPDSAPDLVSLDGGGTADALRRDTLASEASTTDATPGVDGKSDLGGMKYIAPFQDAAPADVAADAGGTVTKYMASVPDAGPESPPARYLAQMPDSSADLNVGILYMAQLPYGA